MEKCILPYALELLENRRVFAYPAINITVAKPNTKKAFSFLALVDSGAEFSLFTKSDAELLDIKLQAGEKINVGGVTGDKFLAFIHPILIGIAGRKINIDAAFSEKENSPRVLGRNPLFSHFFITLDHKKQNTIFVSRSNKTFEKILYK